MINQTVQEFKDLNRSLIVQVLLKDTFDLPERYFTAEIKLLNAEMGNEKLETS